MEKFNWNQYNGIEILEGRNSLLPLNVWVAIIDNNDPNIDVNVVVSDDLDRKEHYHSFRK